MAAKADAKLKAKIVALVEAKKPVVVKLLPGYEYTDGTAVEVSRGRKKVLMTETSWTYEYIGAVKGLVMVVEGCWGRVRAKANQIDWYATAQANGVAA